ncbi:uncharacterized protein LOC131003999 [Salvia miltiorrhiza]|uniref:uncharacterized protein LOC131003999 n=1 Tax=Salvia miltiorrhiza TaxID=226208 RepID=UPI0025AD54E4|nr:uncharacterized protein LOC131003999 [Salvia miltiorrhiza]
MAEQRKGNLSTLERNKVAQFLLQKSCNGKLNHGAQKEASTSFGITRKSIYKIWKIAEQQLVSGNPVILLPRKQGNQHKDRMKLDVEKVRNLSVLQRFTIRKMAVHLSVSKSQVGNWIKERQIRAHTSAIKPTLNEVNKLARLRWSLSHLSPDISNGKLDFTGMHNTIHIDEKWFYITKCSDRYYLLPDEEDPYRSCKSKRFITKVMFMCAVTRPLYSSDGELIFDGKIGIFPFTTKEPAKRNSKNRLKGTLETKPIQAITKSVIKDCIIKQVVIFCL